MDDSFNLRNVRNVDVLEAPYFLILIEQAYSSVLICAFPLQWSTSQRHKKKKKAVQTYKD